MLPALPAKETVEEKGSRRLLHFVCCKPGQLVFRKTEREADTSTRVCLLCACVSACVCCVCMEHLTQKKEPLETCPLSFSPFPHPAHTPLTPHTLNSSPLPHPFLSTLPFQICASVATGGRAQRLLRRVQQAGASVVTSDLSLCGCGACRFVCCLYSSVSALSSRL